ncbi:MAG: hypothetical protein ACRD0K_21925 [Egibacteraceae bacterium]
MFWTLEDPAAALRSARRLLRPGGTLVVIDGDWFRNGWDPDQYREYAWYQTWVECYADLVQDLPLFDLKGPQDVARFVVEAGFTDVKAGRLEIVERRAGLRVGDHLELDSFDARLLAPVAVEGHQGRSGLGAGLQCRVRPIFRPNPAQCRIRPTPAARHSHFATPCIRRKAAG